MPYKIEKSNKLKVNYYYVSFKPYRWLPWRRIYYVDSLEEAMRQIERHKEKRAKVITTIVYEE